MSTTTQTDHYGIERLTDDEPSAVDKIREKAPIIDRLMRMNERYMKAGGNQYAAGITYFSVLAVFPILMLVFAVAGFVLASRPELLDQIVESIRDSLSGQMGETVVQIIETAIAQRSAILSIGTLTALWSGLGWMNNLRYGLSKMWRVDATGEANFFVTKLQDLGGLVGLLLAFIVAFGVTAIGGSGLTETLLDLVGLGDVPGASLVAWIVSLLIGLLANFLVFCWLIIFLPRTTVPRKSGLVAALVGAVGFEIIKQFASLFFSNALSNPAGAVFGPIIGLMVVMYLIWRVLLYCSALAATSDESLALTAFPAPAPAIIRTRTEVREGTSPKAVLGIGAAGAVVGAGLWGWLRRR